MRWQLFVAQTWQRRLTAYWSRRITPEDCDCCNARLTASIEGTHICMCVHYLLHLRIALVVRKLSAYCSMVPPGHSGEFPPFPFMNTHQNINPAGLRNILGG